MITLLATMALGADISPNQEQLLEVLEQQLERNQTLTLPDSPGFYHLRYGWTKMRQLDAHAIFGDLVTERADRPIHQLGVEIRLGSPEFDNTGLTGWQDGFSTTSLPRDLAPNGLAIEAWQLTDEAYKEAVEQYARKTSQLHIPKDYPGDYTLTGAQTSVEPVGRYPAHPKALVNRVKVLSAAWTNTDVIFERAEAYLGHESGFRWVIDTEGTKVRTPVEETTIRTFAHLRAKDGQLLTDQMLWTARTAEDLPSLEEQTTLVKEMSHRLVSLSRSERFQGEYVGPVVFEDGAARDLFRYMLPQQLEGTPPKASFDSWLGTLGDDSDPVRLSRRILPMGWSVRDNPQADLSHPGSFTHDGEGTPSTAVSLVEDGIVKRVVSTRVPRKGQPYSTGHSRTPAGNRSDAKLSLTEVSAPKSLSKKKLYKAAMKVAKSYGHDHFYAIRRLQEPSARFAGTWDRPMEMKLPPPVFVVKVYSDGREVVQRGAAIAGVQRWILRDLVASGDQTTGSYMHPFDDDPVWMDVTEGLPCQITAPDVVVGELELVAMPADPDKLPKLSPPKKD